MLVDENYESILTKQKHLKKILEKYPEFRDGLHQLAISWIQLHHARDAITTLTTYYNLDSDDAVTAYYLAALYGERRDYKNCWHYLKRAEEIVAKENFYPKALRELRRTLIQQCPEG